MVTELATQNNSFQEAFRNLQERQTAASWLSRLRENAMARFEEIGFPTTKEEEWKYTNVTPIARTGFTPQPSDETSSDSPEAAAIAAIAATRARPSTLKGCSKKKSGMRHTGRDPTAGAGDPGSQDVPSTTIPRWTS